MKIIRNKILPIGKNFYAMNIFGVVFAKGDCNDIILNHELIHTLQMRELLYIPFYVLYFIEWLIKLIRYRNNYKAYRNISFEKEAYINQYNPNYQKERRKFTFLKYY